MAHLTSQSTADEPTADDTGNGLRQRCLGFAEVFGQSIANDGPSLAIATGAGLVAIASGAGTTWVFVVATVAIVLVALNLATVARRVASAGSLYEFARRGIGSGGGFLVGWSQLIGYACGAMFSAVAVWVYVTAFFADSNVDSSAVGWGVFVVIVVGLLAGLLAFRSIRLSTRIELVLEVASVIVILVVAVIVLVKNGANVDHAQFTAKGSDFHAMVLGFPLAVLSFVGFESSASLGVEAKKPFQAIPRSILGTAVGIGIFFIVLSYVQLLGFDRQHKDITKSAAPLNDLATYYGVGGLGQVVSAGVVFSAFGIALACLNAASRIALSMSEDGLLPAVFSRTHPTHRTPSFNVLIGMVIIIVVPAGMVVAHKDPIALLGYFGEFTALGLLVAYLGVCIAAPIFLHRISELRPVNVVVGVVGALGVIGMIVGQCVPLPPSPIDYLLLGFAAYLVLGVLVYGARRAVAGKPTATSRSITRERDDSSSTVR